MAESSSRGFFGSTLGELKPLVPYLLRYRRDYAWGALVTVLSNAVWIFFPLVIRPAINDLKGGITRGKLLHYALLLVALAVAKGVLLFWTRWILIGISRDIEFNMRNDLFATLEKQPAGYFQRNRTGDIMARMTNDLNAVRMLLGPAIMYSANTVLFTIGALYFLLRISPMLTLVALARASVTSLSVFSSKFAEARTVATMFGIRSARRWYCVCTSAHLLSTSTDCRFKPL